MCGICGIMEPGLQDRDKLVESMIKRLHHRGPDAQGVWGDDCTTLGHARLSIIDLSPSGKQPMSNEDNSVWVVLNGEIYNYRELKKDLEEQGHCFRGTSDTEVLPHLYEEYGVNLFSHLHGMFALAIWDTRKQLLLLARDRVGKKPLFYAGLHKGFAFASEMKALLAIPDTDAEPRAQGVYDYLTFGVIPGPDTIYSGIHRVPPGHYLQVTQDGVPETKSYWQLEYLPKYKISGDEAHEEVLRLLRQAVRLRLRSDVPVGSFLSGGIDSGLVTAIASQESDAVLNTYTIGFQDKAFDERELARSVAEYYGTNHKEFLVHSDMKKDIEFVLGFYDEPHSGPSAVPSFAVSRLAAQHTKVVLNGDGGDETFAGYRRYMAEKFFATLDSLGLGKGRPFYRLLNDLLPMPRKGRNLYQFLHRFIRGLSVHPDMRYMAWTHDRLTEAEKSELYGGQKSFQSYMRVIHRLVKGEDGLGAVDRMLRKDFCMLLPDDHLIKMDIATMAYSLEARSPLLDHKLLEFTARLPENIKLSGYTTKPILRSLAERFLPAPVIKAPKKGFEVPIVRWMSHDLNGMLRERVLSSDSFCMATFDHKAIRNLIDGKEWDIKRWANIVWSLLCLEIWWDVYRWYR